MRILFFILKIIGILLLAILFMTVLLVFYPVSYWLEGKNDEELSLHGRLSWLFRIVRLEFALKDHTLELKPGILCFHWNLGGTKSDEKSGKAQAEEKPIEVSEESLAETNQGQFPDARQELRSESEKNDSQIASGSSAELQGEQSTETAKESVKKATTESTEKSRNESNAEQRTGFLEKVQSGKTKASGWKNRAGTIREELTDERNKMAISHIWQEVLYLLSHLKPKYIQAEIDFSVGDPAATGQATGMLSLLPIMYQKGIHVYPDFMSEEFYIRGSFCLKGHMALFHMIRCFIRIWKDKNIKRIFNKFRK